MHSRMLLRHLASRVQQTSQMRCVATSFAPSPRPRHCQPIGLRSPVDHSQMVIDTIPALSVASPVQQPVGKRDGNAASQRLGPGHRTVITLQLATARDVVAVVPVAGVVPIHRLAAPVARSPILVRPLECGHCLLVSPAQALLSCGESAPGRRLVTHARLASSSCCRRW